CSPPTGSTRARPCCCARRTCPARTRQARSSTSAAATAPSRAFSRAAAPRGTVGPADGVHVAARDGGPDGVRFAQLWSNPPIRVGKAELHAMLGRWLPRLPPDGAGWLGVGRHLRRPLPP